MRRLLLLAAALGAGAVAAVVPLMSNGAATCTTNVTTSTFASAYSSAGPGAVLCLASGTYATFAGSAKTGIVTIQPQSGATVTLPLNFVSAKNLTIDGVRFSGSIVTSQNISVVNSTATGGVSVGSTGTNILFDHDTFTNTANGANEGRLSLYNAATGVTVTNSLFSGNTGCSDGVQLSGNASANSTNDVIGPGNEFTGIVQGSCSAHTDPVQFVGADNITITGNYFHDNSTGLMAPDGGSNETVTNNVFAQTVGGYPNLITAGSWHTGTIQHNTFTNNTPRVYNGNSGVESSGMILKDNIVPSGFAMTNSAACCTIDYNMGVSPGADAGDTGPHGLLSSGAVFAGGTTPTTFAGYALASSSPGVARASDGSNIGINVSGGGGTTTTTTTTTTVTGPTGPAGPPGPAGATGPAGPAGATGPAGPKGDTGSTGAKGDTGADGATGPQGPKGDIGVNGVQGPAGPPGATGPKGDPGVAGSTPTVMTICNPAGDCIDLPAH